MISNPFAFQEYGHEALRCNLDAVFLSEAIDASDHETDERIIGFRQWAQPAMYNGFFQFDLRKPLYDGMSVAFSAIQIAVWMGFREITIAGIDLQFDPKDGHFYNSSRRETLRTKGASMNNSTKMIQSLKCCCRILEEIGKSRIISLSPKRNLSFLEYRTVDELVP